MKRLLKDGILALCRHSWRAQRHFDFTVDVGAARVPIYRHMGLANVEYQMAPFQTVIKASFTLRPEGHAVDIGANLGKFLLNLIAVDRSKPYIGFEPLLEAAAYTRRLIVENRLKKHSIIPIALSNHHGIVQLHFNDEYDESATLSDSLRPPSMYQTEQFVATSTADAQLKDISAIALIKLDVEGAELDVLKGMTATLDRLRPPLLIEVMPYAYLLDGSYNRSYFGNLQETEALRVAEARRMNCLALESFFRERDYAFFASPPDGSLFPVTTLNRGDSRNPNTDFLVLPAEVVTAFISAVPDLKQKV